MEKKFSFFEVFPKFFIGVLSGIASGIAVSFVPSILLVFTDVGDWLVPVSTWFCTGIGAFVCGFVSVFLLGCAGLLNGVFSGMCLSAVLLFTAFLLPVSFSVRIFLLAAFILICSSVGGIVAVNIR